MLSKGKLIGLALAVVLMPQLARCQAAGNTTNGNGTAAAAPAVTVSVGPFVATNTCLIATASDANALKCELAAEVNKAKTELANVVVKAKDDFATQRRQDVDAIKAMSRNTQDDAIAKVESRAKQRFDELKGVLDEEKDTIGKTLNLWSIIFAFLGVLATIVGIGVSIWLGVREVKRARKYEQLKSDVDSRKAEYDTLKGELEQRKKEYDTLKKTLEDQQKEQERKEAERQKEYENLKKSLEDQQKVQEAAEKKRQEEHEGLKKELGRQITHCKGLAAYVFTYVTFSQGKYKESLDTYNIALDCFVEARRKQSVRFMINFMIDVDQQLRKDKQRFEEVRNNLEYMVWRVTPAEVRAVLAKEKDVDDLCAKFEKLYATYGKPKEEDKQPNGEK